MNKTLLSLPTKTARWTRGVYAAIGIALTIFVSGMAMGQNAPPPGGGERSGPPPEAVEACEGKAVADICSMVSRRDNKKVGGQCIATPDKKLACLPEGAPKPKG